MKGARPPALLLAEGNAETHDSWSGISNAVLRHLRLRGLDVTCGDCDLYGLSKYVVAARTWRRDQRAWWARYHLHPAAFASRSAAAARAIASARIGADSPILQVGATFEVGAQHRGRVVLYVDGTIAISELAAQSGVPCDAAYLSARDLRRIRRQEQRVYARADAVLCISDRVRDSIITDFGVPAERVHTVFAGANIDVERVPAARPRAIPQQPTVLFIGRQFERKGGDLLLRIFPRVRARVPNARLQIIGVPQLTDLPEGVESLGLIRKDAPDGFRALLEAYGSASVYCTPSRYEGLSIAFLEAMLFGLPCVSLAFPWMRAEMIVNGETGITVRGEDPDALTDALVTLLNNPDQAHRFGEAGRRRALQHFTWPTVAARIHAHLVPGAGGDA